MRLGMTALGAWRVADFESRIGVNTPLPRLEDGVFIPFLPRFGDQRLKVARGAGLPWYVCKGRAGGTRRARLGGKCARKRGAVVF
jgi:hypothetical protein